MTTNNNWPGKPGVPLHPERDGWHWVSLLVHDHPQIMEWFSDAMVWADDWTVEACAKHLRYLGPVLTPDEAAALQKRVAELEGAIRTAAECIDADDTIAARGFLDVLIKKYKPKWVCPNNTPGCLKNCGNYGCGN